MMNGKKYELTAEKKVVFHQTLYRIRALVAFGNVQAGELGGCLSRRGSAPPSRSRAQGRARFQGCL